MEGLPHLHVPQLFFHTAGCKCTTESVQNAPTDSTKYFCYPETSNLTLEEVDWLFYEGDVVRRSRRVAKHGWEAAEGAEPHPGMLETGSVASDRKHDDSAEKTERTNP